MSIAKLHPVPFQVAPLRKGTDLALQRQIVTL